MEFHLRFKFLGRQNCSFRFRKDEDYSVADDIPLKLLFSRTAKKIMVRIKYEVPLTFQIFRKSKLQFSVFDSKTMTIIPLQAIFLLVK